MNFVKKHSRRLLWGAVGVAAVAGGAWVYSKYSKLVPVKELKAIFDAVEQDNIRIAQKRLEEGMEKAFCVARSISASLVKSLTIHVQSVRGGDLVRQLVASRQSGKIDQQERIRAWKELTVQNFASLVYAVYLSTYLDLYAHCLAFVLERHLALQSLGSDFILSPTTQQEFYSSLHYLSGNGSGELLEIVRNAAAAELASVSLNDQVGAQHIINHISRIRSECGEDSNLSKIITAMHRPIVGQFPLVDLDPISRDQLGYFDEYVQEILESEAFIAALNSNLVRNFSELNETIYAADPPASSASTNEIDSNWRDRWQNGQVAMAKAVPILGPLALRALAAACLAPNSRSETQNILSEEESPNSLSAAADNSAFLSERASASQHDPAQTLLRYLFSARDAVAVTARR